MGYLRCCSAILRFIADSRSSPAQAQSTGAGSLSFSDNCTGWPRVQLNKIKTGICPSAANCTRIKSTQLEHRTPGVGVENGITPCRLSACSMLWSVEATFVGGLLPLFSQYRTERG